MTAGTIKHSSGMAAKSKLGEGVLDSQMYLQEAETLRKKHDEEKKSRGSKRKAFDLESVKSKLEPELGQWYENCVTKADSALKLSGAVVTSVEENEQYLSSF